MVEHRTGLQRITFRHLERLERRRRAIDADDHIAQVNGLTRLDINDQARVFAVLDLAVDLRLIVAERLRGFLGLLLGAQTEIAQRLGITIAEIAYIPFDVGLEVRVGGLDPDVKAGLGKRRGTDGHQKQAAE